MRAEIAIGYSALVFVEAHDPGNLTDETACLIHFPSEDMFPRLNLARADGPRVFDDILRAMRERLKDGGQKASGFKVTGGPNNWQIENVCSDIAQAAWGMLALDNDPDRDGLTAYRIVSGDDVPVVLSSGPLPLADKSRPAFFDVHVNVGDFVRIIEDAAPKRQRGRPKTPLENKLYVRLTPLLLNSLRTQQGISDGPRMVSIQREAREKGIIGRNEVLSEKAYRAAKKAAISQINQ